MDQEQLSIRRSNVAQSKRASALEALANTSSAIVLSLISYQFIIGPLLGFEVSMMENLWFTGYFTVLSLARGYIWRRWFTTQLNAWLDRTFPDEFV